MDRTKHLDACCQHCGGHIRIVADAIGTTAACPHCGQRTELTLPTPPEEPIIPKRVVVWTLVAVLILLSGFGGALWMLKRAQKLSEQHKAQPTSQSTN